MLLDVFQAAEAGGAWGHDPGGGWSMDWSVGVSGSGV